jgi:hypothetical protein
MSDQFVENSVLVHNLRGIKGCFLLWPLAFLYHVKALHDLSHLVYVQKHVIRDVTLHGDLFPFSFEFISQEFLARFLGLISVHVLFGFLH